MTAATTNLHLTLKEQTLDLHRAAERHAFQGGLFSGRLPLEKFADELEQMLLVHRVLEAHLARLAPPNKSIGALWHPYHARVALLEADLKHFGRNPAAIRPLPCTTRFIESLERAAREQPAFLVGAFYVQEGSTNGAKYISAAIQKAFKLTDTRGLSFLDPHGEEQQVRWGVFRDTLAGLAVDDATLRAVLEGAKATFAWTIEMMDALVQDASAPPVTGAPGHHSTGG